MHKDLGEDTFNVANYVPTKVIFVATNRRLKGYTEMKSKSKYHKIIIKIKEDKNLV